MKIFEYRDFPSPKRVRMFMAEKGIEKIPMFQVDVPKGEHREKNFLTKNPYGTVPVLELDNGVCISETVAISRYFEERYPDPSLMGTTAEEKAEIEMWQRRIEQSLYDSIAAYFHHATPGLGALETYQNEDWGRKNLERYLGAMSSLDERLEARKFICGDSFTIADITAYCAFYFASLLDIAIPSYLKNLARWHVAVSDRPSANA